MSGNSRKDSLTARSKEAGSTLLGQKLGGSDEAREEAYQAPPPRPRARSQAPTPRAIKTQAPATRGIKRKRAAQNGQRRGKRARRQRDIFS